MSNKTNKIIIGNSVLYGVVHGSHVELKTTEQDAFAKALRNLPTFYEGPKGHEPVTMELFKTQTAFNKIRDYHLIEMMKTTPGVYFAGSGHIDIIKRMKR